MLPPDEEKYRAPALDKGLDILELLASTDDGQTQAEIANLLGRTTPEIFRMLVVLRRRGYVELGHDDRYRLTTKMFEVAHRHPPIRRLTTIAGDAMQRLANQINQSVHMCILQSGRLLVIAQADCPDNNLNTVRLGAQIPIYDSASARVLAALMDEASLENLLRMAGERNSERRDRFLADLPRIRETGYCEGASLTIQGVTNLSAAVVDYTGKPIAAMTTPFIHRLTGPTNATVPQAREALVLTCQELSRRMGAGAAAL
ncbi:transcriptional regulator, IclR family [Paracoccus halophilus]|uniref:Transcriptional regulator, IclR family n=1 Tax=Paracoccus halophilus TaxID=376733 RepID=A0A1I0UGI6_9RHOB|nr:IclR family transcriptional regulator [Paracoccus halophilus]SFA62376.1 transcriptional regulator, IclR family [Paracoccus halophilus]